MNLANLHEHKYSYKRSIGQRSVICELQLGDSRSGNLQAGTGGLDIPAIKATRDKLIAQARSTTCDRLSHIPDDLSLRS